MNLISVRPGVRFLWLCVIGSLIGFIPTSALAQPAEIIVIRHAEKPSDKSAKHLSAEGEARAKALVQFVKENAELNRHGAPAALFATKKTKNGNGQRPAETLKPLAKCLKLPIQKPYQSDEFADLAKFILSDPSYDKKTVLICWTHESIPPLLNALGIHPPPPKLHDSVYDRVYVVDYTNGQPSLKVLKQSMRSEAASAKAR